MSTLVQLIARDRIEPDPDQPRKVFNEEGLKELAATMVEAMTRKPPRQPIRTPLRVSAAPVKGSPNGMVAAQRYRLIDGERRWRAAHLAGLNELPCIVEKISERDLRTEQLVANKHERLSPLEQARAWRRILDGKQLSIEELARREGKELSSIYEWLQLCDLSPALEWALEKGQIGATAALLISRKVPADEHGKMLAAVDGQSFRRVKDYVDTWLVGHGSDSKEARQEPRPVASAAESERSDSPPLRSRQAAFNIAAEPEHSPSAKATASALVKVDAGRGPEIHPGEAAVFTPEKGWEVKPDVYFVVKREGGEGTYFSEAGGWAKTPEKAKHYRSAEEAFENGWMAGGGHSVIKIWPNGQWQPQLRPSQPSATDLAETETPRPERSSLSRGAVEISVQVPKGEMKVNRFGVFERYEGVSFRVGGCDAELELCVANKKGDWWSSYSYEWGFSASSASPSINGQMYDSREAALRGAFGDLIAHMRAEAERKENKDIPRVLEILERTCFFALHKKGGPKVLAARATKEKAKTKGKTPAKAKSAGLLSKEARERIAAAARARWAKAKKPSRKNTAGVTPAEWLAEQAKKKAAKATSKQTEFAGLKGTFSTAEARP